MRRPQRVFRRLAGAVPVLVLLGLLVLSAVAVQPAHAQGRTASPSTTGTDGSKAPHPFYLQLLEEGIRAWQGGDAARATEDLRLAVFGLLDHPPELVRGLAWLALAEAGAGEDEDVLRDTLERLVVVEDRFRVYAGADLPATARQALADLLAARLPEATLLASPTFRDLGERRFLARIQQLPPRERRAALQERVARQPGEARWQLALGAVELESGEPAAAAGRAASVLAAEPPPEVLAEARCLRGRALASTGACAAAVADLLVCPRSRTEAAVAADLVGCQVRLQSWREAADSLAALPAGVRSQRALARLDRQVQREVARLPAPAAPGDASADNGAVPPAAVDATRESTSTGSSGIAVDGSGEDGSSAAAPSEAAPPASDDDALPEAARLQMEEARRQMAAATRAGELSEPLRLARQVADAHAGSIEAQHLVGEIAYRASDWEQAVRYFRRGGIPARPEHRFYLAVALFESGDRSAAAEMLERALPQLPRSPFVDSYVERIRSAAR